MDFIYLSDLNKVDFCRYKCIILVNAYKLNESQKTLIKSIPKTITIVSFYGIGYCDGKKLDVCGIKDVTGIEVEKIENSDYYYDLSSNEKVYNEKVTPNPCFCVTDKNVDIFGVYENGKIAVAKKSNVIYFAFPLINYNLAKKVIDISCAHRYIKTGDVALVGNNLVLINALESGKKQLRLKNGKAINFNVEKISSIIFNDETGEVVMKNDDRTIL